MFNFDAIAGAIDNAAGLSQPIQANGLAPFANNYGVTYTTTSSGNESLGVSGVAGDKFASGTNALVFFSRTLANAPAMAWDTVNNAMNAQLAFRYTVGFRFKLTNVDGANSNLQAAHNLLTITTENNPIIVLGTNRVITFAGAATSFTMALNTEYYLEVVVEWAGTPSGTNYTPTMTLYIDGVAISSRTAITYSAPRQCYWRIGCVSQTSTATSTYRRFLYGDIYSTDGTGDAPYNSRLGPQRCRVVYPDEVVSNTWTLSEGTDPLALITGANARVDSKYLTAPDSAGVSSYRLNLPTTANSVVNGLFLFARCSRTAGATRTLTSTFSRTDGTQVAEGPAVTPSTALTDLIVGKFTPTTAAQALDFRDSVLQNAIFALKAPV
jgi:hypothetical protein